jgi:thymidine kinase
MGELQIIMGCMYAGKTAELQRRVRRQVIAGRRVQLFKPSLDERYSASEIVSHDRSRVEAIPVADTRELIVFLNDPDVIAIDELQFFDAAIVGFCLEQVRRGRTVIASALSTDFRGEPFRFRESSLHIGDLLPHAVVTTLRAICTYRSEEDVLCGEEADMTQRLLDGAPAPYDSPLVQVGGAESYEARCRRHHRVQ